MSQEREIRGISGWTMLFVLPALIVGAWVALFLSVARRGPEGLAGSLGVLGAIVVTALCVVSLIGFTVVNPNEARVITLFGVYKGTTKTAGFWWFNPFTRRRRLSLRVRNFESGKLKVNDNDGNPI